MSRRFRDDDRYGPPAAAYRFLNEHRAERLWWLWPQRLAIGCLSLLIGDPGVGKSLLTADLAGRLTRPGPWPDDPAAERPDPSALPPLAGQLTEEAFYRSFPPIRGFPAREIPPSGVVFVAPEDRVSLHGRLEAAGANLVRVSVLDGVRRPFSEEILPLQLPSHLDQLDNAIGVHDDPRLVVLDPIQTLLDGGMHSSPERQVDLLTRLTEVARRRGVAILGVGHLTKHSARRVLYRSRGSLGFVAAARSVLLLTHDPDRADRRILTQIKNAYGPLGSPLAFRIAGPACESPSGQVASPTCGEPHLEWDKGDSTDWRLASGGLDLSVESLSAVSDACDWLGDFLSEGPRAAREVLAAGREAGFSRMTLFRARRLLKIRSRKQGCVWFWGEASAR